MKGDNMWILFTASILLGFVGFFLAKSYEDHGNFYNAIVGFCVSLVGVIISVTGIIAWSDSMSLVLISPIIFNLVVMFASSYLLIVNIRKVNIKHD